MSIAALVLKPPLLAPVQLGSPPAMTVLSKGFGFRVYGFRGAFEFMDSPQRLPLRAATAKAFELRSKGHVAAPPMQLPIGSLVVPFWDYLRGS